jgi:hypothetical protein
MKRFSLFPPRRRREDVLVFLAGGLLAGAAVRLLGQQDSLGSI